MSTIRIGLNGFGRIGRYFTRLALSHPEIQIVAINDLMDVKTATHLLKYDSVHGKIKNIENVSNNNDSITVDNHEIKYLQYSNPADIPWNDLNIDIVVEATGKFLTREKATTHLKSGVQRVVLSAPSPDNSIPMIVMGINENSITEKDTILSNASCTTNSAAPLIAVIQDLCEIESAYITTVHSYTTDERLHDSEHKDLRRARARGQSIVPPRTRA